jgi:hypothetical protein
MCASWGGATCEHEENEQDQNRRQPPPRQHRMVTAWHATRGCDRRCHGLTPCGYRHTLPLCARRVYALYAGRLLFFTREVGLPCGEARRCLIQPTAHRCVVNSSLPILRDRGFRNSAPPVRGRPPLSAESCFSAMNDLPCPSSVVNDCLGWGQGWGQTRLASTQLSRVAPGECPACIALRSEQRLAPPHG